jgi:PAS domain S-box-containing protein
VYYLQFWSAFANEWADTAHHSEADTEIAADVSPVQRIDFNDEGGVSAPVTPALAAPRGKRQRRASAPEKIIDISAIYDCPTENQPIGEGLLGECLLAAPLLDDTSLEPRLWPADWSRLEHGDQSLLSRANTLLDELAECATAPHSKAVQAEFMKYQYLTQYGTQILALFTPAQSCGYVSQNFETLTGISAEHAQGEEFFTLLHPDHREKLQNIVLARPDAQAKPHQLRCKLQHADGKYYWYQFAIHSTGTEHVCIMESINEHVQTQSVLQKAKLEAELALRSRSEFLANMSHELRTPLNAVIGFSQIMESGIFGPLEPPQYREYVHHIHQSGYDLLSKIEDLLEIASIDAGRTSLSREEVYVGDIIKHVLQAQAHHAEAAGIALEYVPRGDLLLFVDRVKLQHIVGHLVANAIKFSTRSSTVRIEVSRAPGSGIALRVSDEGVGMTDMQCHDIREALQQDNCWTAKNGHTIGIGLALTKEFVALHGGEVAIESCSGEGTQVTISLPRDAIRMAPARKLSAPELKQELAHG